MSKAVVTGDIERVNALYRGYFAEPVFAVLGNPAKLYSRLLRHLAPFGAKIGDLSINLSVLAEANAGCFLPGVGIVRVWIDRLEVYVPNVTSQEQLKHVLSQAIAVMLDTDESLRPVKHEATVDAWVRLEEEPFSSYVRRFATVPNNRGRSWRPSLEFVERGEDGTFRGSVRLEEAAHIPEGLFVKSTVNLGTVPSRADELITAFAGRLREQLAAVELDLPIGIE